MTTHTDQQASAKYLAEAYEAEFGPLPDETTERFYVTVQDAGKTGFLLGPYDTHAEALDNVDRGKRLAQMVDAMAVFFAYGTTKVTGAKVARTVFDKEIA